MIRAVFTYDECRCIGVTVSGHAGFADKGEDIVCAYVSASVQFCGNLLERGFALPVTLHEDDRTANVEIRLGACTKAQDDCAQTVFSELYQQLKEAAAQYPACLTIKKVMRKV